MSLLSSLFGFMKGTPMSATQIQSADAATVIGWLNEGSATIVDVREPHEFQAAHIPGAVSLPLSRFDPARVPLEPGRRLVFHCQGGMRCGPASAQMVQSGHQGTIYRLTGGFNAWTAAGGPVER